MEHLSYTVYYKMARWERKKTREIMIQQSKEFSPYPLIYSNVIPGQKKNTFAIQ